MRSAICIESASLANLRKLSCIFNLLSNELAIIDKVYVSTKLFVLIVALQMNLTRAAFVN